MPASVKYLVDESGHKTTVLVPVQVWEDLNTSYQKLQQKLSILTSIQKGLKEVESVGKSGQKLQTLTDFLK